MGSFATIHWPAIALAALAYYLLGALWFTPLFGRTWDTAVGFDRPTGYRFPTRYYVTPLVSSLVVSTATAVLIDALQISRAMEAVQLGGLAGIGYAAAVSLNNAVAPNTPRPLVLGAVTGGYHTTGIIVSALIVSAVG